MSATGSSDPSPTAPEARVAGAAQGTEVELSDEGAGGASPYRNLLVPLVVVPALIVMVLVLVFALFGAVTGKAESPAENLETVLHGGANERRQAAFALVRQILDYEHARNEGRPSEWGIDDTFLPRLRSAREQLATIEDAQDLAIPFVLSSLMAQLGDPEGVHQMIEMTRLSEALDPKGDFRVDAVFTLGAIGRELGEPERRAAAEALVDLLASEDHGMVLASAAALQNLPAPATIPALSACLADRSVEIRLQAALSLVRLGDRSGVPVLREMIHPEPYLAEREAQPQKWAPQRVSESRAKAIAALVEIGEPIERELLERWSQDDPDPDLRGIARKLLAEPEPER